MLVGQSDAKRWCRAECSGEGALAVAGAADREECWEVWLLGENWM